jgi:hypothetical protein
MFRSKWPKILLSLALTFILFISAGCATQTPTRWDQAQQTSTQKTKTPPTVVNGTPLPKKAVSGGKFNQYFPQSGNGFTRIYVQEKAGFAEAKLEKGGKTVAMLSINDLASNPTAAQKYSSSTQKIGGYPAVQQGANATAVLVGNRYQVKVQSRDPSFSASDRQAWIQKFNLNGLASVK